MSWFNFLPLVMSWNAIVVRRLRKTSKTVKLHDEAHNHKTNLKKELSMKADFDCEFRFQINKD